MTNASEQGSIVVGVDGSPGAGGALAWAVDEARLRGAPLWILHAFPAMRSLTGSTAHEYYPQVEKEAEDELERILAAAPDVSDIAAVTRAVRAGNPAEILIEESRSAALVVVGSRGLGGFAGLVLGSVSAQVSQHAHCPVVVVRHDE